MKDKNMSNGNIFFILLKTRLLIARPFFIGKLINLSIWAFCSLFITGYVMQQFGLSSGFGTFQIAGIIGTAALFEIYPNVITMVLDFASAKTISYYLTLPTSAWIVIASMIIGFALQGIGLSFCMIPLSKMIFLHQMNLLRIAWPKLIITIIIVNLFFSSAIPAIAATIKSIDKIGNTWSRFIFPLWFLGGFQFSWHNIYSISKPLAYFFLLNPVLYVMEALRSTILGYEYALPWHLCITIISIFCIINFLLSYRQMKKLLDFV